MIIELLDTIKKSVETLKQSTDTIQTIENNISVKLADSQSSSNILDFINVLIWPILTLVLIFLFYKPIKLLIERIATETEEFEFMGLKTKLRQKLGEIEREEDPQKLKGKLKLSLNQEKMDEFKILSSYFFTKSFQIRKKTAIMISKLSNEMSIEDLISFANSSLPGERAAAFIGIKTHLELFKELENNEHIIEVLSAGLDDAFSRVRYRVVLAISVSPNLIAIFKDNLQSLLDDEPNNPVKEKIKNILKP